MAIIGIDLGTTFSAISALDDIGNPEVIADIDNNKITPSIVYISKDKKIIVGDKAKNAGVGDPKRVIAQVKKRMYSNDVFDIKKGDWTSGTEDLENTFSPSYVSACILKKLKSFTANVEEAVITVPALFANSARNATAQAAESAGLKVLEIINEPTAAILHYSNLPGVNVSGRVLVFDLGGGTFDITIADVQGKNIDVLTSKGDPDLGGTNFDDEIFKLLNNKYMSEKGKELKNDLKYLDIAEKMKRILSVKTEAKQVIDGPEGPLEISITREEFIESINEYLQRIKLLIDVCLDNEGKTIKADEIQEILLVGGSTRMPIMSDIISQKFGKPPIKGVDVDEAVAAGAAIYAGLLSKEKLNTAQKESIENIELQEITNHHLGTIALRTNEISQATENYNSIIIPRNSKLPCEETKDYYTVYDGQPSVNIQVTQSGQNTDNVDFVDIIGEYSLELPPNTPQGDRIDTTYSYDVSGIMHCKSVHVSSGKSSSTDVQIQGSKNISTDEDPFLDFDLED